MINKIKTKLALLDRDLLKYTFCTLVDFFLSVNATISIFTSYKLYQTPIIFYFIIYNLIISIFTIVHFVKICYDLLRDKKDDVPLVKVKVGFMFMSFIWALFILTRKNILNYYETNYPKVFFNYICYFVFSAVAVLGVLYKVLIYVFSRKNEYAIINQIDVEFGEDVITKEDEEFIKKLDVEFGSRNIYKL